MLLLPLLLIGINSLFSESNLCYFVSKILFGLTRNLVIHTTYLVFIGHLILSALSASISELDLLEFKFF